ncbi:hypothetical protein [Selenomonas ruminantium]|nr:hypothetical protein [Selenomonas ruminantium]
MMNSRKFSMLIASVLGVFILLNIVLWQGYTKDIFYGQDAHGDLKRMGGVYVPPSQTKPVKYTTEHYEFPEVMDNLEAIQADVLTIGDSFSNGTGGNYYQDYLCSTYGWKILNVPSRPYNNALQMMYSLQETGLLAKIKPKVIILESLAANMEERFGSDKMQIYTLSLSGLKQAQNQGKISTKTKNEISADKLAPGIMIKSNLEVVKTLIHHQRHPQDYRINDKVGLLNLSQPLFSNEGWEDKLLVHLPDSNVHFSEQTIKNINNNINAAAELCREQGIVLVFMPVANKADVYYPYIKDVPPDWQVNKTMQELDALPKDYLLVNTEQILQQSLTEGDPAAVKDLFWLDDLHFSWKAQQIISDDLAQKLKDVL